MLAPCSTLRRVIPGSTTTAPRNCDVERIQWLEDAGVKRYKIASRSLSDLSLVTAVADTGKPILASLGCWQGQALPDIKNSGGIKFLYCVSKYPTPLEELGLSSVDFERLSGFSDHSLGITAACAAFVLGAQILEKHFTLDKSSYGPDHAGSMNPEELKAINAFRTQWEACR
jgi:sialic acid synthase SpsE